MIMAVKTQNTNALLRRPLPPQVLTPLSNCNVPNGKSKHSSFITEKHQKKKGVVALQPLSQFAETTFSDKHVRDLEAVVHPYKPRGPDPLPARIPKRVRENPYEVVVDDRFTASPMFTLADFLKKWDNVSEATGQATRIVLERSKDATMRALEQDRQDEVHQKIIDGE